MGQNLPNSKKEAITAWCLGMSSRQESCRFCAYFSKLWARKQGLQSNENKQILRLLTVFFRGGGWLLKYAASDKLAYSYIYLCFGCMI